MKNASYLFLLQERVIRILHFAKRQQSNSSFFIYLVRFLVAAYYIIDGAVDDI